MSRMIRSIIILVGLYFIVACRPMASVTTTTVRHCDFDGDAANRTEIAVSEARLHRWLADRRYRKLHTANEIKEATHWSGDPSSFSEVYTNAIAPLFSKSFFVVTVSHNVPERFFRITLTSNVTGTTNEQNAQHRIVAAEEEGFLKALRVGRTTE